MQKSSEMPKDKQLQVLEFTTTERLPADTTVHQTDDGECGEDEEW